MRGVTAGPDTPDYLRPCFNPRPSAGRDTVTIVAAAVTLAVSILAPVRGVTRHGGPTGLLYPVSILAPVRGVTRKFIEKVYG